MGVLTPAPCGCGFQHPLDCSGQGSWDAGRLRSGYLDKFQGEWGDPLPQPICPCDKPSPFRGGEKQRCPQTPLTLTPDALSCTCRTPARPLPGPAPSGAGKSLEQGSAASGAQRGGVEHAGVWGGCRHGKVPRDLRPRASLHRTQRDATAQGPGLLRGATTARGRGLEAGAVPRLERGASVPAPGRAVAQPSHVAPIRAVREVARAEAGGRPLRGRGGSGGLGRRHPRRPPEAEVSSQAPGEGGPAASQRAHGQCKAGEAGGGQRWGARSRPVRGLGGRRGRCAGDRGLRGSREPVQAARCTRRRGPDRLRPPLPPTPEVPVVEHLLAVGVQGPVTALSCGRRQAGLGSVHGTAGHGGQPQSDPGQVAGSSGPRLGSGPHRGEGGTVRRCGLGAPQVWTPAGHQGTNERIGARGTSRTGSLRMVPMGPAPWGSGRRLPSFTDKDARWPER